MKKALMLAAAIALIAAPVFAQDEAPTLGGLHGATGSVEFSFGDDNIGADEGFGFSSDADGSLTGTVKASIATDKVEAGATISLVPSIELEDNDETVDPADSMDLNIAAAEDLISWYEGNSDTDYNTLWDTAPDWEAIIAAVYGNNNLYTNADGFDIDDTEIDTDAEWTNVWNAVNAVASFIEGEIDAFDTAAVGITTADVVANGEWYYDQFDNIYDGTDALQVATATAAQIAVVDLVNDAASDYAIALGEDGDDEYLVSFPVSDAYFRLLGVAGVVDVEFELNGKEVGVGSKFTEMADDANLGIGLALTDGVVEGLSASVLYTNAPSAAAVSEDYTTLAEDVADAEAAVNAIGVKAGYAADMFNVNAEMAIADLAEIDFWFSVMGGVSLADIAGLKANVEFTKMSADNGMGIAVDTSATMLGITPSVDFRYHIAGDSETDSYDLGVAVDDTTDDGTALDHFNSVASSAGYLGIGLSVDFAEIMGMSLITLDGGFGMVFGGAIDFNVGLGLDFTELFAPVTLDAGFNYDYDKSTAIDAALGAEFFGVTASVGFGYDITDAELTFDAGLGYTYDVVDLKAAFGINADEEKSLMFTAKTSF